MKKIILRFVVFILIFFILLLILSRIVIPKNNTDESGINNMRAMKILGEPQNTIDVIMYGDSESYASTIPMQLWNDYGFTFYICGTSGQTLPDTCSIAYDTLKNQSPKLVILEADNIYAKTEIDVPIARILYKILPVIEYHNRWKSLKFSDFFGKIQYTDTDHNKGYHYLGTTDSAEDIEYMEYSDETDQIPLLNKVYVRILKKYCESKGIKFAIVSVPSLKNWSYEKHNGIMKFAEEENIEFLDLNEMKDEIGIDWQIDTSDQGDHVNYTGARKVTSYIGKWLYDKNLLENHKEDINYNNWNEDLKIIVTTGNYF